MTLNDKTFSKKWATDEGYQFLQLLQVLAIFFLHHRHFHAITGTSSCFLNNPYLFADDRHMCLGQEIYFTSVCRDKLIRVQEN